MASSGGGGGGGGTPSGSAPKARRSTEEVINEILKRVLHVSVEPPSDGQDEASLRMPGGSQVVLLEDLAAELMSEEKLLLLSQENVERAIMARLEQFQGAEGAAGMPGGALGYCLGAYSRALEEGRKVAGIKDKERLQRVQGALEACKELLLSYALLSLQHPDMFGSAMAVDSAAPPGASSPGNSSPLTPLIAGPFSSPPAPGQTPGTPTVLQVLAALLRAYAQEGQSVMPAGAAGMPAGTREELGVVAQAMAAAAAAGGLTSLRMLGSRGRPRGQGSQGNVGGMGSTAPATPVLSDPAGAVFSPGSGLPGGFLEELLRRTQEEGEEGQASLATIFNPVFKDLSQRVSHMSLLGSFQSPLRALAWLSSYPPLASAIAHHPQWAPPSRREGAGTPAAPEEGSPQGGGGLTFEGRVLELESLLGPFLHLSVLPDMLLGTGEPDIIEQLFSKPSERRSSEISSSYIAIRTAARQLWEGLHEILKTLLKNAQLREQVLQLLAAFINRNAGRGQMQVDPRRVASDGCFYNLSALMLKLCEPFIDGSGPSAAATLKKLDPAYVLNGGRLDLSQLTALHATSGEIVSWVDQRNLARQHTFLQVQQQREQEELQRLQQEGAAAAAAATAGHSGASSTLNPFAPTPLSPPSPSSASPTSRDGTNGAHLGPPPGAPGASSASGSSGPKQFGFICECFFMTARVLHLGLLKIQSDFKEFSQRIGRQDREALRVLEAMRGPGEPADLEQQIQEHKERLDRIKEQQLCYDVALRDPELVQQAVRFYRLMVKWLASLVGGFVLPLPAPCPMDLAAMPEHFVEDMLDTLLLASYMQHALDGIALDDFVSFCVMFMASPLHIKNPYLRAKMVELLRLWMPKHCPTPAMAANMAALFEGHPLAMQHLTPNLLRLYVDIEFTGSHNAFYDKFNIRANISDLLEYLWGVPSHRMAWIKLAVSEEKGFYLRFLSLLINDSIYLLDEALEKIPKIREEEAAQADREQWLQLPVEERQRREADFQRDQQWVKSDLQLADANVHMLEYTTGEITRPFLLPEMVERVAAMLNYFLLQLVGAKRKALRVSNPEKYGFQPRKLLTQIVTIYVHLGRGDKEGSFAEAISADGRSYRPESFTEAAAVLRSHGLLDPQSVAEFVKLGERARAVAEAAQDFEEQLEDIPAEFLDPVQFTIMKDPVLLPSNNIMDRSVIMRHLLSDPKDPFTRSHLTPEMLKPHGELKDRIEKYLQEQRQKMQQQRQQ